MRWSFTTSSPAFIFSCFLNHNYCDWGKIVEVWELPHKPFKQRSLSNRHYLLNATPKTDQSGLQTKQGAECDIELRSYSVFKPKVHKYLYQSGFRDRRFPQEHVFVVQLSCYNWLGYSTVTGDLYSCLNLSTRMSVIHVHVSAEVYISFQGDLGNLNFTRFDYYSNGSLI